MQKWHRAAHPAASKLSGAHKGLSARKGPFNWAAWCWEPARGLQGSVCLGGRHLLPRLEHKRPTMCANPAQSNLGLKAKTQSALQVLQPAGPGTHSSHNPHSGNRGCHTQRLEAWPIAVPGQFPHFKHRRLSAFTWTQQQDSRLPFPSTIQKYRSHTMPARAVEKTLGSAARMPTQATPAQPEIPPSPVASPRDPISPRSLGPLW